LPVSSTVSSALPGRRRPANRAHRRLGERVPATVAEPGRKAEDDRLLFEALDMLNRKLIVLTTALLASGIPLARAADPTGLPEAFDAGWEGRKPCELLYENEEVRVGRCTFPPGVGHEKHYHVPHFGYVLEGSTLQVTDDQGETRVIETATGDSWSTSEITVHSAVNIGDTTARYLIVEPRPDSP
jgi:quercetin dioxygenase-like cupin family protein